ncbi:MAG: methylated-DNA--[protein]-cysteine S-methyltransferase [Actinomycetota bacterium]
MGTKRKPNQRGEAVAADPVGEDRALVDALRRRAPQTASGVDELSARAAARFADAAWRSGSADVAYAWADSPFGPLLIAVSRRGLVRLSYPGHDHDRDLEELARRVSPRVVESPGATENVRRQLDEYFDGGRRSFDLAVDLSPVHGFGRRVLQATARIPFGSVRTYREVATGAGNALATRAAGNALGANPVPIVVPCHRVVRTGGGLGGYTGGLERKETLLRLEGVLPGPA